MKNGVKNKRENERVCRIRMIIRQTLSYISGKISGIIIKNDVTIDITFERWYSNAARCNDNSYINNK